MKLNTECVRDLLLYLETNLSYQNLTISINGLKLKDYSEEELLYTADKLREANYINCIVGSGYDVPVIIVKSLSYTGHQFLDTVRDNKIWKQTKSKFSTLASVSLPVIQQLASSLVKNQLGLS